MLLLVSLYSLLFTGLAWRNFRIALGLFLVTLPTYLIRFNLGPFPTTLLELSFEILFLVWLIKYARSDWPGLRALVIKERNFFIALGLFFLASIAGILISDQWYISLGQWRAYFLEPVLFFIVLLGRRKQFSPRDIAQALVFSTVSISVVAVIQATTGELFPPSLWDDIADGRATSFFTSPNAVGLYLGPCLLLALALALEYRKTRKSLLSNGLVLLITLGLFASLSVGGLLAVAVGLVFFAGWYGKKQIVQTAVTGVIVMLVAVTLLPVSRNLINTKIHSGNNRLTLWQYSEQFFTTSPKNFIFGAGIRQFFRKVQKPHYNVKELERLIYPHNFFLNFWSETGLLGMLSISYLFGWLLLRLNKTIRAHKTFLSIGIFCALITLFAHGLIDVPYFKNDLALLFWALCAASFIIVEARNEITG